MSPESYNGKIKNVDKVITLSGKRIEAFSNQQVLLDVDGEQPGMLTGEQFPRIC